MDTEQPKNLVLQRKEASFNSLSTKQDKWLEYEKLFHNELNDAVSGSTKSQVFDPKLSTMVLDREARVMAQLPTGKIKGISKNDAFAEKLMNLTLDKYVNPNANSQFDLLTKYRMVDRYSNIYGNFFGFVDWRVDKNGYVGPDMWLLNIRDVFPQVGAISIEDSDYIIIRTWQPLSYFESLLKNKEFKNIKEVVRILKDKTKIKDYDDKDSRERSDYPTSQPAKSKGYYEVLSMYERDKWTDYVTDADLTIREIDNPHDNNELPVVCKYSIPLLSDFFGMGDFERGKSMQYTLNSLWNLYLDGVKISIFPPTLINKDYVADLNSIKWSAAAKWLVKGASGADQAAKTLNLSPQGANTFNNVYQIVTSSLLNMMGTTDTSVSSQVDPGFGKSQRYSEPVLTMYGWKRMGDIIVGDYVFDDKGKQAKVEEIHEQGIIDTYDVSFSDGSKTNCSLDHLWTVNSRRKHHKKETLTLKDILDKGYKLNREFIYSVDLVKPIDFPKKELKLDPYLLGLLLGDGGFSERGYISFTNSKERIINEVIKLLPSGDILKRKGKRLNEFRIFGKTVKILEEYGLKDGLAKHKFIPEDYLFSCIEDRQRLLKGLLDTDGYQNVVGNNSYEYCTVSEQLANNFMELSRGLGNFTRMTVGISSCLYKGEKIIYGKKYRIFINTKSKKNIIGISKNIPENSRCLFVDTPNHLYVTTDYTITHNTPEALKQQGARENARDNVDRFYMEKFLTQVNKKFVNLLSKKQSSSIQYRMFSDEIDELVTQYADVKDMYDEKTGKITIDKKKMGSTMFDYEIVSGSTYSLDQKEQQQNLLMFLELITKNPVIMQQLEMEGKVIKIGDIINRILTNSGIQDASKFILDKTEDPESMMREQMNQFMQTMNGPNIGAVPPNPNIPQVQGVPQ